MHTQVFSMRETRIDNGSKRRSGQVVICVPIFPRKHYYIYYYRNDCYNYFKTQTIFKNNNCFVVKT